MCFSYFGLPKAIGTVKMHHLVGESKWAHPCFRDASTVLPGVADGKPYAAVFQPSTVTLVVLLETPGGVKLADQRQRSSLTLTCVFCLLVGERPRYVGDSACERRKDIRKTSRKLESSGLLSFKCWHTFVQNGITGMSHIFLTAVEVSRTETAKFFPTDELFHHVSPTDCIVLPTYYQSHSHTVATKGQHVATHSWHSMSLQNDCEMKQQHPPLNCTPSLALTRKSTLWDDFPGIGIYFLVRKWSALPWNKSYVGIEGETNFINEVNPTYSVSEMIHSKDSYRWDS